MSDSSQPERTAPEKGLRGESPYATGGGGFTFERRVAVTYLARPLTGDTSSELDGRSVDRVSFQQAPRHPVDDLVISASRDAGIDPLTLEVAVRRAPAFTTSDADTEHLVGKLLASIRLTTAGGADRRLAICVAGPQPAAREVEQLAEHARQQASAQGLFTLIRTPGRFSRSVRDRLQHLVNLVKANVSQAQTAEKLGIGAATLHRKLKRYGETAS